VSGRWRADADRTGWTRRRREDPAGRRRLLARWSKHNENKQLLKRRNDHQNVKLKAILNHQTMQ